MAGPRAPGVAGCPVRDASDRPPPQGPGRPTGQRRIAGVGRSTRCAGPLPTGPASQGPGRREGAPPSDRAGAGEREGPLGQRLRRPGSRCARPRGKGRAPRRCPDGLQGHRGGQRRWAPGNWQATPSARRRPGRRGRRAKRSPLGGERTRRRPGAGPRQVAPRIALAQPPGATGALTRARARHGVRRLGPRRPRGRAPSGESADPTPPASRRPRRGRGTQPRRTAAHRRDTPTPCHGIWRKLPLALDEGRGSGAPPSAAGSAASPRGRDEARREGQRPRRPPAPTPQPRPGATETAEPPRAAAHRATGRAPEPSGALATGDWAGEATGRPTARCGTTRGAGALGQGWPAEATGVAVDRDRDGRWPGPRWHRAKPSARGGGDRPGGSAGSRRSCAQRLGGRVAQGPRAPAELRPGGNFPEDRAPGGGGATGRRGDGAAGRRGGGGGHTSRETQRVERELLMSRWRGFSVVVASRNRKTRTEKKVRIEPRVLTLFHPM